MSFAVPMESISPMAACSDFHLILRGRSATGTYLVSMPPFTRCLKRLLVARLVLDAPLLINQGLKPSS